MPISWIAASMQFQSLVSVFSWFPCVPVVPVTFPGVKNLTNGARCLELYGNQQPVQNFVSALFAMSNKYLPTRAPEGHRDRDRDRDQGRRSEQREQGDRHRDRDRDNLRREQDDRAHKQKDKYDKDNRRESFTPSEKDN